MSNAKILCVDDEPSVLDGLRRNLRREFDVTTAVGGAEGLSALEDGGFDVVVSDYQMPEMSGAEFLGKVRDRWPETTRVLLTGNADLDAAIATVNEGQIYRFLSKPCPKEVLIPALQSAVAFHRLVVAERVLLQDTLRGAVRLLVDALALASPDAFGRCGEVAARAARVAEELGVPEPWKVEMATLLAQVPLVTLPPETLAKLQAGEALSPEEQRMVARMPGVGRELLAPLPRIEDVVALVEAQGPPWGAPGEPQADAPLGAIVLRACVDADLIWSQGVPFVAALQSMEGRSGFYPPAVLEALAKHAPADAQQSREIGVLELVPGMVLIDSIETTDGRLLVASGSELTPTTVQRIRNFRSNTELKEPVRVCG